MTDTDIEPVADPRPGEILAKARTEMGLSIEDVAAELRLSSRQISALEADDHAHLPGPTYVRGYLRNYARLLGLPPEQVLPPAVETTDDHISSARPRVERQVQSGDRFVKLITYVVVLGMIALVVAWWRGHQREVLTHPLQTAEQPAPSAPQPEPQASQAPSTASPTSGPKPVAQDAAKPPAPASPPAETASISNAPVAPAPAAQTGSVQPAAAQPAAAPPPGQTRIVLHYSEDCWTDIRDARNQRLVYRTVSAGQTVVVDGVPPFNVFLGNAKGATLEYNGKPYDFNDRIRGVFARFDLGGQPANTPPVADKP